VLGVSATALCVALAQAPKVPPPMQTIAGAITEIDFRDLPAVSTFTARDGTRLSYRAYPGDPAKIAVLVHGSSGTSDSMHAVAKALQTRGWTAYALAMRGHDGTGRYGDIDYAGQLNDDLADFVKTLPAGGEKLLFGFSCGGFVLQFAGGAEGKLFDRFVLISPQLPAGSPTMRPNAGGWVSIGLPRIIALEVLSRFGIHWFEGLTVLEFAVAPENRAVQTAHYSYRMMRNFGPSADYLGDIKRAPGLVTLLAGDNDELFYADKFASTLKPARPDMKIVMLPGLGHMDMTVKPLALEAVAQVVAE
jgi:pimeloyl-ACP methyl ester carboxylesterase